MWVILLTNGGPASCALTGTPVVTLRSSEAETLPSSQTDGNFGLPNVSTTPTTVALPKGGEASFVFAFLDNGATVASCPQADELVITLPDGAGTLTARTDLAPCYGKFAVSPILPRTTAP